jgi:arylsulfatase A-like enzyme
MIAGTINGGHRVLHFFYHRLCTWTPHLILGLLLTGCQPEELPIKTDTEAPPDTRPNVLLVVVDDVGFSDLGFFGGEIPTPTLDGLAASGITLTNFHVAPTCSPTRSMLLSGVDSHQAGLGNMFEELAPNQKGQKGYEGYLHERVAPLPALFQEAGYQTFMSGKWHLGLTDDQSPTQRGFDKAFALLEGGAGHFSDMQSLWQTEVGIRGKAKYRENGVMLDELPESFEYSSQFYVDKLIEYLENAATDESGGPPFFAYLAFTAPHWPLQAPPAAIQRHKGNYDLGYEKLARQRLARQIDLGILPPGTPLSPRPSDAPPWEALTAEQKALSARRMEIYAAMIDEVDRHLGRLVAYMTANKLLENTVVVFLSDNGAEGHSLDALFPEAVFPKAREWVLGTFDYDYDSLGSAESYVLYGPGWGWAATSAFRGYKAYVTQGGTRVPAFIRFPQRLGSGEQRSELLSVKDIAPTLLDLAGIPKPQGQFKGRPVVPISGESMVPLLQKTTVDTQNNKPPRVLGYELFGKRSLRQGRWSAVEMYEPQGTGEWQLYDLDKDLAEQQDLATAQPDKLAELISLWQDYAAENNIVIPDWNSGY